jgi:hypothetical protein
VSRFQISALPFIVIDTMKYLAIALLLAPFSSARADGIVERRIWIETAIKPLQEDLCTPDVKAWHCAFPDRIQCGKVLKELFNASCSSNLVPDLPEYIDGPESKAAAMKLVTNCLTTELAKKYLLPLTREKMEDYNVCTGAVARSKPMNPMLTKALDFSKVQTKSTCNAGGFMRKCFSLSQGSCDEALAKEQLDCTMKMEKEGVTPKDDSGAEETGKKVTDCAVQGLRKALDATHKRLKDKDCE